MRGRSDKQLHLRRVGDIVIIKAFSEKIETLLTEILNNKTYFKGTDLLFI